MSLLPATAGQPRCMFITACATHWPANRRTLPPSDAEPTTELFAPIYSLALAPDPLLAAMESSGPAAELGAQQGAQEGDQGAQEGDQGAQQGVQGAQQGAQEAQQDVFLAVGLDSGLSDFKRPRLNLAILLDVSGSMDGECAGEASMAGRKGSSQESIWRKALILACWGPSLTGCHWVMGPEGSFSRCTCGLAMYA